MKPIHKEDGIYLPQAQTQVSHLEEGETFIRAHDLHTFLKVIRHKAKETVCRVLDGQQEFSLNSGYPVRRLWKV